MSNILPRRQAVDLFVDMIVRHVYRGTIDDMLVLLRRGPPGRAPDPNYVTLHTWFSSLDERNQALVTQSIQQSVRASVFSMLTILDHVGGGPPLSTEISDFALYLQVYESTEKQDDNVPQTLVRLNPVDALEDMHDIFLEYIDE